MSDKALQVAKEEILRTIQSKFPEIEPNECTQTAEEILQAIDWDNPALMHKSISWIVCCYLQSKLVR